jgi:hypothetical protein
MNIYKYINNICEIPDFLNKYLNIDILVRLKDIGYFCGMDYASKDIYDFKYEISRYDHSLSTALLTWRYSKDKVQTIAALFHDISTPCFSHVIDYMNKDYANQESTEDKTEEILNSSKTLPKVLASDNLTIKDLVNYKNYPIVDNKRPKLCADRLDGIILTGLAWTKDLDIKEIPSILDNIKIYINESNKPELGFKNKKIALRVNEINHNINIFCHSKEDNYMMNLLADLTNYCIRNNHITYDELYTTTEKELYNIFSSIKDEDFKYLYKQFKNIKLDEIPLIELPHIKERVINPIVRGKRLN